MTGRDRDPMIDMLEALDLEPVLPGSMPCSNECVGEPALVEALGDAAPDAAPPSDLFDRIEAEIDAPDLPGISTIAAAAGKWSDRGNGVWCKLMASSPDGKSVYMLRCMPGGVIPEHFHKGWEYALVLEGAYQIAGRTVRAGDAQNSAPNSFHPEITTEDGCLLLVVA